MTTLLEEILSEGGLTTLFQPIFDVRGDDRKLFAVEALSRGPKGSNVERADVLFEYVRRKGSEAAVDRACTAAALRAAARSGIPCAITINVHASTLEHDGGWLDFLSANCDESGLPLSSVILEIVEQQKFWDERRFFETLDAVREAGVRIALDDIGLGYSNYQMLIEIRPEFYKIDPYFISGSSEKPHARAAVESIVLLARRLGGIVIAEGVESIHDLRTLRGLGIHLAQGYYLGLPSSNPLAARTAVREPAAESTLCVGQEMS